MTIGIIKILIEDFNFYYDDRNNKNSGQRFQFLMSYVSSERVVYEMSPYNGL
jgi:hypothetical protein